ncbi:HAUS augmin-like complex subunit 1 [Dissophora globulifera]|uniref:HAUS augmin-like complex subunit 1 n=1 Tax=Dissophora globulifera TaxID=979702 RepID=A0A9P6UXN0_9FUNG|nr:HAUS augmin-like complex subunit 1 [Dissophora globulifera]
MWSTRHQLSQSTASIPRNSEWTQIDQWLQSKYQGERIPSFERTEASAKALREYMQLNQTQDAYAREAIRTLKELSASYRSEDIRLKENLQVLGLQKDLLPTNSQLQLAQLSDLAMLLGISDTTLASFEDGFSQLVVDSLHYSRQQVANNALVTALDTSRLEAQSGLDRLLEVKRQLTARRETHGDIEQRTRRRSAELRRIRADKDKATLETILRTRQSDGLDVEAEELTMAQLDGKEKAVAEFQRQLDSQSEKLAVYKAIPPDYMLAKLKLQEASMQLNELTAEHESLLTEMASDL